MSSAEQNLSSRQSINAFDFEFFHNTDHKSLKVEYHNHDFYEVYFLISGDVTYLIEGKSYKLRPGDIILINDKELHKPLIQTGTVYERFVIWLRPEYIRRLSEGQADLTACFEKTAQSRTSLLRPTGEIFSRIKKSILCLEDLCCGAEGRSEAENFGDSILKKSYIMELIVYLNRAYLQTHEDQIREDVEYNAKINELILFINENLSGNLSLDVLSKKFYISKYHLLRQFKACTGFTIHHFIQKKRLILAKTLLLEGSSVRDAFIQSGFGNYSNFSKSFKNEFNAPPRRFAESGSRPDNG